MVLSWPPCWVAEEVNTDPTFPTSAPFVQSGPVWSMKVRIFALTLLKRVGAPKTIAS